MGRGVPRRLDQGPERLRVLDGVYQQAFGARRPVVKVGVGHDPLRVAAMPADCSNMPSNASVLLSVQAHEHHNLF